MARCLCLLIISFALTCFCSDTEFFAISDHQWPPFSLFEESGSGEITEPPSTSKPVTTAEVLDCQNGGMFNGSLCICRPEYSGKLCENLETTFEPDTYNRSVEVTAEISVPYDEDFADEESDLYQDFAKNFTDEMHPYYKAKLSNLKEVVVNGIREGNSVVRMQLTKAMQEVPLSDGTSPKSVVVDHEVILTIPNDVNADDLFENNVDALKNATDELVGCTDCPYVAVAAPNITEEELDIESVCKSDPELGFSLQAHEEDGTILCLTQCDNRHTQAKTCHNKGKCNIAKYGEPFCQCQDPELTWYLGDDCSSPIKRQDFYIGISVTLVCLVVTVGALAVYLLLNKHRRSQKKDVKEKLVKEWLNEDFEWSRSNSAMNTNDGGVERNAPSLPGPSHLSSTNQMRIPSVPHAAPHLDSAFSLDRQIRINRPQIKASWDD